MGYTYVFGPVMSGRLGLSLGLDLLGCRVCSMDCVYCEVGATDTLTLERKAYVPATDILAELEDWASKGFKTDYVTLGGSGEPCLNTEMREIMDGVRRILPGKKIAVLTNSTLLTDPSVREELQGADVVLPSLDSLVEEEFRRINRAHKNVSPLDIAEGMLTFRSEYTGCIYLEILLATGYNDSQENLERLKDFIDRLKPDRVDITTLSRPGTRTTAKAVDPKTLKRWQKELGGTAQTTKAAAPARDLPVEKTLAMIEPSLARRPQTAVQLASALGATKASVRRALAALDEAGKLSSIGESDEEFFALKSDV